MTELDSLSDRDLAILEHVARYRLSTDDVLTELFFPDAKTMSAVQSVTARLTRQRWLSKSQPLPRRNVYTLGPGYTRLNPKARIRPFTEQSLPAAMAILYYCVRNGHKRLTMEELRSIDPGICEPGTRSSSLIVLSHAGGLGVSLLLVDRASPTRRVLWKVKRTVRQRVTRSFYLELIRAKRFSVTILVPVPDRAVALQQMFRQDYRGSTPIFVCHVPEFAPFVFDLPTGPSTREEA
ncbi:MAG: hypothetical protein KF708_08780 [Pirellulales bacterium]|nr:hypothetical protein [Pirellulales bacterium]